MRAALLLLAGAAALPAVEFSPGSLGGSPIPIGAGARALGMGGAFSAVADDSTAATWNPAGMAQLERPELGVSGGYYHIDADAAAGSSDRDEWRLEHAGGVLPFYALGFQQALGLSWQRRYDLTASVDYGFEALTTGTPPDLVESQTAFDRDGGIASWALSYAVSASDTVNLGIGIELWDHDLTQAGSSETDFRQSDSLTTSTIQAVDSSEQRIDDEVSSGLSLTLGVQWRALPELTLSGVLKPGFELDQRQEVDQRDTSEVFLVADGSLLSRTVTSSSSSDTYTTQYPDSATIGVAWRPSDRQLLAADLTWTRWSDFTVERDGDERSAVSDLLDPEEVDDDFSLRIGYEHLLILPRWVVALRGGALYERLPGLAPLGDLSDVDADEVDATVEDWFGLTGGVTGFRRRVTYDLAAQLRWGRDVGAGVYAAPDATADVVNIVVRAGFGFLF